MISVILTTFNEINNPILWENVEVCRGLDIVAVDGGSRDGTGRRLKEMGLHVLDLPGSNRAQRLNAGIKSARGEMLLLLHPRTRIQPECIKALQCLTPRPVWGGFTHRFDDDHAVLRFTSWYSNRVRGRRGIIYFDHCLFFSRDLIGHAVFPNVDLFEETYFCRSLRRVVHPAILPVTVTTSAVRFRKNGITRQAFMNQVLKVAFAAGVPERWMNAIYERGLGLNK